jgi:hypothetical protein
MAWITVLMAAINAVGALAKYLSDRQLINAAQSAGAAEALKRVQNALAAGDAVDLSPSGLRRTDSDERPD